MQNAELRPWGL